MSAPSEFQSAGTAAGGGQLAVFRRRWWTFVVCIVIAVGASAAASALQSKKYTAEASLLFRDPGLDQQLFGDTGQAPASDPAREAATNVRLVSLEVVAQRAARRLDISRERVTDSTEVKPEGTSNVVTVSATDESADFAARLANTLAQQSVAFQRATDQAKIQKGLAAIRRRITTLGASASPAEKRALQERAIRLETLKALQTGNADLVQPAVRPDSPSSPKPIRNGVVALILGALAGLLLALLRDRGDQRLRSRGEIEELVRAPVLGQIPEDRSLASAKRFGRSAAAVEAVQLLRANLRFFNVKDRLRSVGVTSAARGEGKTTVAWTLCMAAAQAGQRVLLIEADLRRPTVARVLRLGPSAGLSGVLAGDASLADAIVEIPAEGTNGSRNGGSSGLYVIPAGPIPPNPADLLESTAMLNLLHEAEEEYDLVVIDTSPVGSVADAIPLLRETSGTLVIARLGVSERGSAARLRDTLANVGVPILGVVIDSAELDAPEGVPAQPAVAR